LYVNAGGVSPGSHQLPILVSLPDGLQLVRQSPDRVKLRIYRERIKAASDGSPS